MGKWCEAVLREFSKGLGLPGPGRDSLGRRLLPLPAGEGRGEGQARSERLRPTAFLFLILAALPSAGRALPLWLRLPEGVSSYSGRIDGLFRLILWITGIIFVVVEALLLFFLLRYRHREGRRAHYTHGNNRLEVIWTIIPAVICVVLALLSRRSWAEIKQQMPGDAMQIGRASCRERV